MDVVHVAPPPFSKALVSLCNFSHLKSVPREDQSNCILGQTGSTKHSRLSLNLKSGANVSCHKHVPSCLLSSAPKQGVHFLLQKPTLT